MKKLLIHIGTPKTGSTTLQTFLASEDFKRDIKALYPNNFIIGEKNATFLLFPHDSSYFLDGIKAIKDAFLNHDLVIISEEILSFHFVYNDVPFNTKNGFIMPANVKDNILYLINQFPDVEIEFLIYLRRQDKYIESELKETIKDYGYMSSNKNSVLNDAFKEYITTKEKMLDYHKWVNDLVKLVGSSNVKVKSFDKCIKTGLIKDFMRTYNININDEIVDKYEKCENKSPSLTYLYCYNVIRTNPKYAHLLKYIGVFRDIDSDNKASLFTKEEAEELVNKYRNGNEELKKYIDGPLFSYNFSNYPPLFNQNSKHVKRIYRRIIIGIKLRDIKHKIIRK